MDEKKENLQETEIDLRVVLDILRKNILAILIVSLVFAAGAFAYSSFFVTKQYQASATLIVNNKAEGTTTVNTSDVSAAQSLADVYSIIIKSDTVLQPVIDDLNLNMSYEKLKSLITVSTVNSTQVITVSMDHPDPEYAQKIIAEIVKVAPDIIKDKVEAGSVKVISESRVANNGAPVSPSTKRYALIGGLVGLVLTLIVVFVQEFMNNTFKTEDDISRTLNIPLLGIIPSVDEKEFNKNV